MNILGILVQTCLIYTWNQHLGTCLTKNEAGLEAHFLKEHEFKRACNF